jgi:guanosine-3',5'-bis(diphosphate) 3'-pyrophosphohydrolase
LGIFDYNEAMKDTAEIFSLMHKPSTEDKQLLQKAYDFALYAHTGHLRKSGEPYFNHLFATAKNIAELGMDAATISAGFLHDTIEDTKVVAEDIEKEFGPEILFLVEGVTKLGRVKYQGNNRHNESLRKLFVAMSQDIRVLIIKLCDRLHNMQTLQYVAKEKQLRIATETLEIYAPLAYRLGIKKLQRELEDLSFQYVRPEDFKKTSELSKIKREEQEAHLDTFQKLLEKELYKNGVTHFHIDHRIKGLYSLYKKLSRYDSEIEKIHDISALRIIVPTLADCYKVLGIVHGSFRPLPERIKDYIATPKLNGYKSIHTTIFTGDGAIAEVQIRSEEMHKEAEYGAFSHASYKDKNVPDWVKKLLQYQKEAGDEFVADIKSDFLDERIFIFTPKGDVIDLPRNSSVIDFAYAIHSDIGAHMAGAKVNGKLVTLATTLQNGDRVEIQTKKSAKPNRKWLEHCKTTMARRHIAKTIEK